MFTHLRQSAHSFFAKLILFFLIAMFGLWGIGDVFRSMGAGPASVATVGKTPISMQQYQRLVQNTHKPPMQVLNSLINDLLIEKEENALGIVVSDDAVANYLSEIPDFHDKNGQFDKALYQRRIAATGGDEVRYIENVRREIAGKLLLSPFYADAQVPEEMVLALYKAQEEKRTANVLVLTPAAVAATTQAVTEQEAKAYYDAHPKDFTAAEVRALSYVALPIADVEAKVNVPEEEIKHTYEERKDDFRTSERRQVEDMEFYHDEDAKAAVAELAKGKTFAQVAATAPIANNDKVSLGVVGAQDLPPDAAEKVFTLKENGVSAPLDVRIRGTEISTSHIYHVSKIIPGRPETLDEARPAIAREIASREGIETAQKLMDGFEDALAGGATFEQAAEKIGQKVQALGPVTRDGEAPDGTKAAVPPYDNFLTVAFTTAEKDHSQAVQAADGSYFVVRVDSVSPEHVRPYSEVKDKVVKAALDEKVHKNLEKTGQDISANLRARKNVNAGSFVPVGDLKRDSVAVQQGPLQGKSLPEAMVGELFRIHPNETTHAYPTEDGNYMVATLASVTPAPRKPDPKVWEDIRKDLRGTLTDETLLRYMEYLRSKYPVSIDAAALGVKDDESGQ